MPLGHLWATRQRRGQAMFGPLPSAQCKMDPSTRAAFERKRREVGHLRATRARNTLFSKRSGGRLDHRNNLYAHCDHLRLWFIRCRFWSPSLARTSDAPCISRHNLGSAPAPIPALWKVLQRALRLTAFQELAKRLSTAGSLEEALQIQTAFMHSQLNRLGKQTASFGAAYTKTADDADKKRLKESSD